MISPDRESYWQGKLEPLRIGAEPIERQLARRLAAVAVFSALMVGVGLIFVAIFAAFGRPDVGLKILLFGFVGASAWAWLDHASLRMKVRSYLREADDPSPFSPRERGRE